MDSILWAITETAPTKTPPLPTVFNAGINASIGTFALMVCVIGMIGNILAIVYFTSQIVTQQMSTSLFLLALTSATDIVISATGLLAVPSFYHIDIRKTWFELPDELLNEHWPDMRFIGFTATFLFHTACRYSVFLMCVLSVSRWISWFRPFYTIRIKYVRVVCVLYLLLMMGLAALPLMFYRHEYETTAWNQRRVGNIFPIWSQDVFKHDKAGVINPLLYFFLYFFPMNLPALPLVFCSTHLSLTLLKRYYYPEKIDMTDAERTRPFLQGAQSVAMLGFLFIVCTLPWWVMITLDMIHRLDWIDFNLQVVAVHIPFGHLLFYVPHTLIWQIKSALNSILYLIRGTEMRKTIRGMGSGRNPYKKQTCVTSAGGGVLEKRQDATSKDVMSNV